MATVKCSVGSVGFGSWRCGQPNWSLAAATADKPVLPDKEIVKENIQQITLYGSLT